MLSRARATHFFLAVASLLLGGPLAAQDQVQLPPEFCRYFINRTGDCVQCSLSHCGVWHNNPNAGLLLFKSSYGRAELGGSGPGRVEAYAERRGIPIYNVTGAPVWPFMDWASKTGRMAAIGCFRAHFQTLLWRSPDPADPKPWKVLNNWTADGPRYEFTDAEFRRHHLASGQWVVILKGPSPPMQPLYVKWW